MLLLIGILIFIFGYIILKLTTADYGMNYNIINKMEE